MGKHIFRLKKLGKFLEFPLDLFIDRIRKIKLFLLDQHPTFEFLIWKVYLSLLISIKLLQRRGILPTVELIPKINALSLKDKEIFSDIPTLTSKWLQVSVIGFFSQRNDFTPFWSGKKSKVCSELSANLWMPTEFISVDSHLKSNSLFSIEKKVNPNPPDSETIKLLTKGFVPVEKLEKESIQVRKIKIYPNHKQRLILSKWLGTSRYVYNKCLQAVREGHEINFMKLRNKYVTKKDNPIIKDWELETPKDIRAGSIRDLCKAYTTAFSNLRKNNIAKFNITFRKRKDSASIEIPKSAINLKDGRLVLFPRFIKSKILIANDKKYLQNLEIDHDCRLKNDKGKWYLYIPVDTKIVLEPKLEFCSFDPGVRTFQTIYSPWETISVDTNRDVFQKYQDKISYFQSKKIKKSHKTRTYGSYEPHDSVKKPLVF